jgi:phosphohistidine phosphatase
MGAMKRLYLLRHAKSSWKDTGLVDHERPLSGRGRRAGKAIRAHLRDRGIAPEVVICSTAKRARQTLELIEPALGKGAVHVEPEIYGADSEALLTRLRAVPDQVESVLLIGHNPAIQDLALELATAGTDLRGLDSKYPTATLVTLAFESATWRHLDRGRAQVIDVVRPREL